MTRTALPLLVLAVGLAACSAAPPPSSAEPTPTPSPSPTPLAAPVTTEELVERGLTVVPEPGVGSIAPGVEACPEPATDPYGTYHRVCVRDDAPVMAFDPDGPYNWLAYGAPYRVRPEFSAAQVPVSVRFVVDAFADPVTQWDDSPEAWARVNAGLDALFDAPGYDLRPEDPASDAVMGVFDVDGWREEAGLEPAAAAEGQTRTRMEELKVDGMLGTLVGEDSPEAQALTVGVKAVTSQVVLEDDLAWELRRGVHADVTSLQRTGEVHSVEWSAWHAVGRYVAGGIDALPVLETGSSVPGGWVTREEVPGLSFALPPGVEAPQVTTDDEWGTVYTYTLPGEAGQVRVERRYRPRASAAEWFARRGHVSYGLRVPGVWYAAAEAGPDGRGRHLVTVNLLQEPHAETDESVGAFVVRWESTPETATDEIRERLATFGLVEAPA